MLVFKQLFTFFKECYSIAVAITTPAGVTTYGAVATVVDGKTAAFTTIYNCIPVNNIGSETNSVKSHIFLKICK